ncbi:hypothetical protein [Paenibacillus alginolyticus]|nr:hypothetical protein [Paenibacillus frigoriresistens]
MESKIRTYQELDYFEKHIVELLEKIHGRWGLRGIYIKKQLQ